MSEYPAESNKKATSSVQEVGEKKPPFGSRFLTNEADVWNQNAWDHVPPPNDQAETIAKSLSRQRLNPVPLEEKVKFNEQPAKHWENFYKMNASNFFRDRKWLHNEFPELVAATKADAGCISIAEVGCGAGNSVFPLLDANQNPDLHLHAYDYSHHAVKLVQRNPLYLSPPLGTIHASVWDVTSRDGLPSDIVPWSVDIVILVFVMSALHPDEWGIAVSNIQKMLKPAGVVLFRDYGRYDLTQLRFKAGRLLDENFYIRGDKTRVYFFELDELALLFTGAKASETRHLCNTSTTQVELSDENENEDVTSDVSPAEIERATNSRLNGQLSLEASIPSSSEDSRAGQGTAQVLSREKVPSTSASTSDTSSPSTIHPNLLSPLVDCPPHPLFAVEQLGVDRRLIVNRKRQLKMYRVWMQGKFRKL